MFSHASVAIEKGERFQNKDSLTFIELNLKVDGILIEFLFLNKFLINQY